ncbi:MAG: carotenoid 1,2-hydratase [Rhizobiaceae bacterium]|nr:carotenoid 1,2-hydratase [Rhizobiaceae bacterium]
MKIPPQEYGWWYADAISDDGKHGFSIIAMIGSVFSPYYAWSGRHAPENHIGFNVGLYGKAGKRWTLTERGSSSLNQSRHSLQMGPSRLDWDRECLSVQVEEWANPIPRKVKGTIKIWPSAIVDAPFQLDDQGKHYWQPFGAVSRVEVDFGKPRMSWSGHGYMDCNWGAEPLEKGFTYWDWSRAHTGNGARILYDAFTRGGTNRQLSLAIDKAGTVTETSVPNRTKLANAPIWRVRRNTLADKNSAVKTLSMLEDTPFYTRSQIQSSIDGERLISIHESLDLDRFSKNWVRCLLPFRMPRVK